MKTGKMVNVVQRDAYLILITHIPEKAPESDYRNQGKFIPFNQHEVSTICQVLT